MPRQSSAKEGNPAQLRLNQALEEDEEWTTGGTLLYYISQVIWVSKYR